MYICSECGAKYKDKPDFCDCGNDTFNQVFETSPVDKEELKPAKNRQELLSWLIFWLCIFLSIIVLAFFPQIKDKPVTNSQDKPTNVVKTTNPNIPDIETFWINPKTGELEPAQEISPVEQIKEIFVKPKTEEIKKPAPKPAQKQTKPTQKPVTQKTPPQNQTIKKPAQTQTQKPQAKPQTTQNSDIIKTSQPVSNMYEFVNYKNRLRNRLLSNLRLSTVQGSGKCGIEFAIDSTGKLIKRGFIYQSENKTVNDAVYAMLMRTPRFEPPPEAYKGEMIKLIFKLDNTNYTIDFAN